MRWRSSLYFSWISLMYGWSACISRMPCIDRRVKGRTTRRESQVIRTIADAPGEPDVVVQPRDDAVEDVDQRLEDVGVEEHGGVLRQIGPIGSAGESGRGLAAVGRAARRSGGRVAEEAPVRELVDAAVAERVAAQQPPAGEDRAADRAQLADRLGPRRPSRSGSTGSAGRGRARPSAGRAGSARSGAPSATVSRQTLPARAAVLMSSASEERMPSCPSRSSRPSAPGRATIT